jgi:hypothetical protein
MLKNIFSLIWHLIGLVLAGPFVGISYLFPWLDKQIVALRPPRKVEYVNNFSWSATAPLNKKEVKHLTIKEIWNLSSELSPPPKVSKTQKLKSYFAYFIWGPAYVFAFIFEKIYDPMTI